MSDGKNTNKNINDSEKEGIYDVLKDNPRWSADIEESKRDVKGKKASSQDSDFSHKDDDEKNIVDITDNKANEESRVSGYLFEDENAELKEENRAEPGSEEYLKEWKNSDTEKRNQEQFQKSLRARKDEKFTFYKSYSKKIAFSLWFIGIAVLILAVYCIASDLNSVWNLNDDSYNSSGLITSQEKPVLNPSDEYVDENGKYTVEGVAEVVRPSIVDIYCYESDRDYSDEVIYGTGSGIIIKANGYIVTNAHVLDGSSVFVVTTENEENFRAELVGKDSKTDIAVLKIDAVALTAAQIGDSDEVVVGEEVVAIGNPAGLSGTVTNGIVSALNREIRIDDTGFDMQCIQTNAAISPGNSGGALVNMYGQVIGITSSKYANTNYEGLGFAVTINQALPVINQLVENGYVEGRVKIGIKFNSMTDSNARTAFFSEYGFEVPDGLNGLWITEISSDCDIADSGLEVGDFIISIGGTEVSDYSELHEVISNYEAGDTVSAECVRYNTDESKEEFTIEFKLNADTSGDY